MIVETVPAALAGERLDRIVALILDVSRSVAAAVIDAGGAAVDGAACTSGKLRLRRRPGGRRRPDGGAGRQPAGTRPVGRVRRRPRRRHGDRRRQAGRSRRPSRRRQPDGTLVNGLLARFPDIAGVGEPHRPGIVHRLDAGSSGLLVVARTQDAADALIEQFASHTRDARLRRARVGPPGGAARRDRRPDRAVPQRPVADGGRRRRPAVAHRVPRAATLRRSGRAGAARVPARDRPHAPDPGPPRLDQPSPRRRSGVRPAPPAAAARAPVPARRRAGVRPPAHAAQPVDVPAASSPPDLAARLATLAR